MIVADDGSRDGTADRRGGGGRDRAAAAAARQGPGALGGRARGAAGRLLLCDADLRGDLRPLLDGRRRPRRRGLRSPGRAAASGSRSEAARALIRLRSAASRRREPLSGQRALSSAARARRASRSRPGFGAETRMTIDAARAGLTRARRWSSTSRTARPAATRAASSTAAASCSTALLARRAARGELPRRCACRSSAGRVGAARRSRCRGGRGDRARGRPLERPRARLPRAPPRGPHDRRAQARRDPARRARRARGRLSGALLVGLAANALNQLDTRPGPRAEGVPRAAVPLRAPLGIAVLLLPTIFARWRCSGTRGRTRWGRC